MRTLRALLITLLIAGASRAQGDVRIHPGSIRFYHQNADFLIQTSAILQDHEGFMWFGQWSGGDLYRYDGHTYTHFDPDPADSLSLLPGIVTVLFEDAEGTLWIGKENGLNRFVRETGTFHRYTHDPADPGSISPGWVSSVAEDQAGTLWVGTESGLNRFDRASETFAHILPEPDPDDARVNWIGSLLVGRDGTLWVGSWGLQRFDPGSGSFTGYLPHPQIPKPLENWAGSANWVQALHEDPHGRIWVGTLGGGVYAFDRTTGRFVPYRNDPSRSGRLEDDQVRRIVDDPDGGLWLATRREGLVWLNPETGATISFREDPWNPSSLSGDNVYSLYRDRQDMLWVGTWYRDVDRLDRAARPFAYFPNSPGGERGLVYGYVGRIAEGPDGTLWVLNGEWYADRDEVLTRIDPIAGTYRHFRTDAVRPDGLSRLALSVLVDRSGTVWTGSQDVLSRMSPDGAGRFVHFRNRPGIDQSLPEGQIRVLFEDSGGRIWIGTDGFGLSRLDEPGSGRVTRFPLDVGSAWINSIFEDTNGRLWVGTYAGLFGVDPRTGTVARHRRDPERPDGLAGDEIFGVWERPQEPGVLWLGIYPFGLGRFEPATGAFRLLTKADGLPDNAVQGVLGDDQGRLWISTDTGLSCFDPDGETFVNYDVDDGLQGESFNAWSYHKGRSGAMYFGGTNGFNAFLPEEIRDNPHPPQLALVSLRIGRELIRPGPHAPLKRRLAETDAIVLTHSQNDLTIEYVALHFRHAVRNRYTHILEGYDASWSDTSYVRQAVYTNLPPGRYQFRVNAANSDGVWNPQPSTLAITILPPWWRTWWAYLIYLLLGLGAAVEVDRKQRARLVRREREAARERELTQAKVIERAYHELDEAHSRLMATQRQLVQAEKMASLGQLTAGIAHQIQNPLNFVNNFAQLVGDTLAELAADVSDGKLTDPEAVQAELTALVTNAAQIEKHGKRAEAIVKSMMEHAAVGSGKRVAVPLNAFLNEYVDIAHGSLRSRGQAGEVEIERSLDPSIGEVMMSPREMGRAVVNILNNAFDAVTERRRANRPDDASEAPGEGPPGEGSLDPARTAYTPRVWVESRMGDALVEIRIADNGPGIPASVRDRVFEPFFTTKKAGASTGLGLSLAYEIVVEGHGGSLSLESEEGQGSAFVIGLPLETPKG